MSDCTPEFFSVPTPWIVKEEGVFMVLSRNPGPQPKNIALEKKESSLEDQENP